ncbi:MAG TPA: hypothetical protein DCF84_05305 [Bacteroidetes bacterium]|nr:hypothetical protein [Bacteroidota bacterium]
MSDSIGKKAAKGLGNFALGIVMFLVLVLIMFMVMGLAVLDFLSWDLNATTALLFGIVASLAYAAAVFFVPVLRKNSAIRWFGICAVGDALWWAYLLMGG